MPRANNGSIEKRRLVWLVENWNSQLSNANPELNALFTGVGVNISDVDRFIVAGGMSRHFDIIAILNDGSQKNIEHKAIKEIENNPEHPWSLASIPQLLNGPYNLTDVSLRYCNRWYTSVMPELRNIFPTLPELPTYEYWLSSDASVGAPKTDFGKALKVIRKADKINSSRIDTLYRNSITEFWADIKENNPEILENFRIELLTKMQACLTQKHYWLNANYTTDSSIEPTLMFLTTTPTIYNLSVDVNINNNSLPKIQLNYNLSSNPDKMFKGEARLRWGNGNGIANIRWNIS